MEGTPVRIDGETAPARNAGELKIVLDVLQGAHDREVLEQLGPRLADVTAVEVG